MENNYQYENSENSFDDDLDQKLINDLNTENPLIAKPSIYDDDSKTDEELLQMSKEDIIHYKNYQITKLRAYISSLEKEKETLISDYKTATDNLLSQIKNLEFQYKGLRPETPMIAKRIKLSSISQNSQQKCPNCLKLIPSQNYMVHSLDCLRKFYRCPRCNIILDVEEKQNHFNSFYNRANIIGEIAKKNFNFVKSAVEHGFNFNETVIDKSNGDKLIHILARCDMVQILFSNVDIEIEVNAKNAVKDTALIIAIENKNEKSAKELIEHHADIKIRNKNDFSPLMLSCKYNLATIAELLIKKGADVNERNILGDTPFKIATMNNNEKLAMKLVTVYKAEIN